MGPSRRQPRLLIPLGVAVALSLTGDQTLYAVLAHQTEVLGVSLAMVGVLLGVNRLIRIPGNLLAGALNDQIGRRRPFLLGLMLGMLSTLSYGLARGFWPLLAGRILWGVAWALINVSGYTMVLDWSTPADRGRVTGFYQMSFMLGLALSPVLGGMLTDALGFRPAVMFGAALSGVGLVVALAALPETRPLPAGPPPGLWDGFSRLRLAKLIEGGRQILQVHPSPTSGQVDRRILVAGYVYLATFFVNGGVLMSTVSLYLGQRWGERIALNGMVIGVASLAGGILALRALLGMLAGPLAGALSDRSRPGNGQLLRNRWPVVRGGILVGVAGFTLLSLPAGLWTVPVGVGLVAVSAGALLTALAALVGDLAADSRPGITMGGLATAGDIGSAVGPLVAYSLAAALDLRWVYLLCALVMGSCLVATLGQGKAD